MAEVSDGRVQPGATPHPFEFTADLWKGKELFGANAKAAQTLVDSKFDANGSKSAGIDIIPYTHNGCVTQKGDQADKTYDRLKADGTDSLNVPTPPGAPEAQDQGERNQADNVAENTRRHPNQSEDEQYDKILELQKPFAQMNKEQTQRVINSANKKLEGTGYRYTQTPDGAVWLGYKQADGSYEATVYMRPPDCNVG
jgi:hypothetical protein